MRYCFGIDIGGTTVKIGLVTEGGSIAANWEIPTRKGSDPAGLLEDVRASLEGCLQEKKIAKEDILGIGMAAPGPVTADGVLHGAVNIGWGDVNLAEEAERIIGISPVRIGNDARVAALGEAVYGAGAGARSMLMVTLGTGVGGGVVLDGKILMGDSGKVSSSALAMGMVKKGLEWLVVLICVYVGEALEMQGIGGAAMTYMIATELVSLLENLSLFGLEAPVLRKLLDVAQNKE